ncbi:MAG: FkbM family methyltransferase [Limnothrix sp.]
MEVESCCQALLKQILPAVDPQKSGHCIDVGVGTFAFYCDLFAKLGFKTIAVEPSPVKKLRKLCDRQPIELVEACLSDQNGTQTLYMGNFASMANENFNSLEAAWFGSSPKTKAVKTFDLQTFLNTTNIENITCLKLDIEGWEPVVMKQFDQLPPTQLPKITMFEYGGGGPRDQAGKGWSDSFLTGTLTCLETLQKCGYGFSIIIDYAYNAQPTIIDLQSHTLDPDQLFLPNAVYGNIISFREGNFSKLDIEQICEKYQGGLVNWMVGKIVSGQQS